MSRDVQGVAAAAAAKKDYQPKLRYWKNNRQYYYMLFVGLVFVILFRFVPLYGLIIAFKDYRIEQGIFGSKWVGLQWFKVLINNKDFFNLLRNTLIINFMDIAVVFFGSIVFALLINEIQNNTFKRVVQTVSYLPHFLSWVVVGGLIIQIVSPSNFIMQTISEVFGIENRSPLLDGKKFYWIVTFGELWKSMGWNTILYLAAMAAIPPELYEAARIDGAGKIQQIKNITLPGIRFIISVTLIMRVGHMMNVGFEKIFVLQNDLILDYAEVFSTWNYKMGIGKWNMSLSTALSFFESVINFILVFGFDRLSKCVGEEGIF